MHGIRSRDRDPRSAERSDLSGIGAITVRVRAVQHEIVVAATRTIGVDFLASCSQLGRVHDIGVCSGRQAEDIGKVAIDERQVDDGFPIYDSPQSGVLRLNKRSFGANRDLFLRAAEWKLNLSRLPPVI